MAAPKVFFVHLRRPRRKKTERRDDPFYEFGSFGCTGCHKSNLFHPRNAAKLSGAKLAFVQGGSRGSRLVFLTPPIKVKKWCDLCEAKWRPKEKPFKYDDAPILAYNEHDSDFPLIEKFARDTHCPTVESGLSSRLRSLTRPLSATLARQVIAVYERKRAKAPPSAFADKYEEALPYAPPKIDRERKRTYRSHLKKLRRNADGGKSTRCGRK
jgi:hypothetical protein